MNEELIGTLEETARPLSMTVSLSRKINLGNYESAEVFVSVSGVTAETTEEEVAALLANRVVWDALKEELREKTREVLRAHEEKWR